jgi:hypothetical protein
MVLWNYTKAILMSLKNNKKNAWMYSNMNFYTCGHKNET